VKVDPQHLLENGYVIVPQAIAPERLEGLRASYEKLVDRQRLIWVQERQADDPPGGHWETDAQPRLSSFEGLIDADSADAVEFCMGETTLGVCRQLMQAPDVAIHRYMMMCSPVQDHGPASWHRDIHPIDQAPINGLQLDLLHNYPAYLQWNIALYEDDVLWVVPGSHRRSNTEEENQQLQKDNSVPLPNSMAVELEAGDGVVYTNTILHWGSNYSSKLRRTIHLGYRAFGGGNYSYVPGMYYTEGYSQHLTPEFQQIFARHQTLYAAECDRIEATYRALIERDEETFRAGIEYLHSGEVGRIVCVILLSKLAYKILFGSHPNRGGYGGDFTQEKEIGPRFSKEELEVLWQRFEPLDNRLQAATEQYVPGFQSGPMPYYFQEMPEGLDVDEFIATWKA
jgi:ectoine hydroxylase-related dioxygenase (phytanoyl-CoA dioxygenase family)